MCSDTEINFVQQETIINYVKRKSDQLASFNKRGNKTR